MLKLKKNANRFQAFFFLSSVQFRLKDPHLTLDPSILLSPLARSRCQPVLRLPAAEGPADGGPELQGKEGSAGRQGQFRQPDQGRPVRPEEPHCLPGETRHQPRQRQHQQLPRLVPAAPGQRQQSRHLAQPSHLARRPGRGRAAPVLRARGLRRHEHGAPGC